MIEAAIKFSSEKGVLDIIEKGIRSLWE